ncbi:glutamine synthetase [Plakobranchus ocellatus]|uniref:Lengsin n=1 Tax=Plakobranchus ocellatus TaxID=259542 RepID=A0AAV4AGH9_9GAST|nr:glutamine synthetase [Plakobranchus ocellatus]
MDCHFDNFDFIELKVYDIHGYTKGRLVSSSAFPKIIENGHGLVASLCYKGIIGQLNAHPYFREAIGHKNVRLYPLLETLMPCQKIVQGDHKIASVLCETRLSDGTLDSGDPRQAALALLEQLHSEFGLKIKSSFEAEFGIRDSKTDQPFVNNTKWASTAIMQCAQDFVLDMVKSVTEIGIEIDILMPQLGDGQYKVTFDIAEGIKAADMTAEFKTASYVYLKMKGFNAEFMACVRPNAGLCHGFHYSFSLWDADGRNVFVDPEDPSQLSEFGRHWLAGLVKHTPGMTALISPTINCYRRLRSVGAPLYANWALENRGTAFQVRIEPAGNVYIENRLPSSACSPHLVLASTLAAGMDGVRRKLPLPQPLDESIKLPETLEKALEELEADTLLKEAISPKLVELFIHNKRVFEIQEFQTFGELSDEEMLLKEKDYYYDYC